MRKAAKVEANGFQPLPLQAHRGGDHLLLGDVHLEVALGVGVAEVLAVGGVRHLAVKGHHVASRVPQGLQGGPVGLARGHFLAQLEGGPVAPRRVEAVRLAVPLRRRHPHAEVTRTAELLDRLLGLLERLAVLAGLVLHGLDAGALLGPGDHRGGPAVRQLSLAVGRVHGLNVVSVDRDGLPAEGPRALGVGLEVPAVHGLAGLAETVHVHDRDQVVELPEGGVVEGLPHRALRHLAVAAEDPGSGGRVVQALGRQGQAHAHRQALAERAGGGVHPGEHRGGMPLDAAAQLAEAEELVVVDRPRRLEGGVVERRRVALGEHEVVVVGVGRLVEIEPQVAVQQHGHELGGRHR